MKHIKKFEEYTGVEYEIYFTTTKNGVIEKRKQYQIVNTLDLALKKVKKLINSFLSLDKTAPRFNHWSLDNYWIEIYDGDEMIQIIDKQEIDARFDIIKYNI